ncbi:ankyrin repeat domain-containing protein SOWAHA isoform X1 [Myripristis murdjan]|uniref:ankyrin repeat domain-containing protein SOWAHA isoform X1 n=1 Tax=Myripristis murdjan TaxID=586833 RepID=UPI001176370D|nr:ankyrin repeat domain-containing protein SOWAHA-like isoform X1 [Myripristis murdjan]
MSDVSEESLLDYFYSSGGNSGKVKNADILKTYKPFIGHSDLQLRAKYREEFKLIIDRIAVVKSENGEKYLVLKKKYRQLLQERDTGDYGTNRDGQRQPSPAGVQVEEMDVSSQKEQQDVPTEEGRPGQVMWCGGSSIASESTDQTHSQEDSGRTATTKETPVIQIEEHCIGEDELDKDSGSKSESEQDEEGTGSMGSTAVALDPIEKEWIYSAACARVPDLSQLLRQDPSLANKKDFTSGFSHRPVAMADHLLRVALSLCHPHPDKIARPPLKCREMGGIKESLNAPQRLHPLKDNLKFTALHWAAKHGREDMATLVVDAGADVNTKSHGGYTPLHIAALHGHRHILDLLIGTYGAKENLRDYSGHLACHYLNIRQPEGPEEDSELQYQATQARERNRNRKLTSLFQSKKKWGSAEDLAPIEEERAAPHQLILPAFRPRKFSR